MLTTSRIEKTLVITMPGSTMSQNEAYDNMLRSMNGQTFNNPPIGSLSQVSPGEQQLRQKEMVNNQSSVSQRAAQFLTMMKGQGMG